jgi:trimethylamine---corrinoid protein Co-methyltransferase
MSLAMYRHAMPFTTKPLQGPGVQTAPEVRYAVRMAEVLGPPREVLTLSVSPVSPLSFPDHEVEAMLEIARQGIAFAPLPCPTAGTTAPFSIAGAIAQQSAEVLVSLVLAQLVQPGLPMIFCGRLAMMEPRTGISVWGGVEMGLASAGTVQLGHRYGLPVNVYGFSTNAHTLDIQNGFERGLNAVIPALAGADELSGIGEMEAGVLSTYAQMVADNEFAASIHRVRRGFVADEDSLAVDVIATVMNGPRNFLSQKHTTRTLKGGEVFITKLAERSSWETWETGGRRGLAEQAQAESERILREHQVEPLAKTRKWRWMRSCLPQKRNWWTDENQAVSGCPAIPAQHRRRTLAAGVTRWPLGGMDLVQCRPGRGCVRCAHRWLHVAHPFDRHRPEHGPGFLDAGQPRRDRQSG